VAHPFTLFLTLPRILQQASVLYYRCRLDVYKRPEPKPVRWTPAPSSTPMLTRGGGIGGWQHPTLLERAARRTVSTFLARRADALGLHITLQPGDPKASMRITAGRRRTGRENAKRASSSSRTSHRASSRCSYSPATRGRHFDGMGEQQRARCASDEAPFCEVFDVGAMGRRRRYLACEIAATPVWARWGQKHPHLQPLAPRDRVGQAGEVFFFALLAHVNYTVQYSI